MSTPGTGNADGDRRGESPDDIRNAEETGRSGAGATSAGGGRAATGSNGSGDRDGASRAASDGGYVPGAYSADEDTSGDYVPGMYSDASSTSDTERTREHSPTPAAETRQQDRTPISVSATREQESRTQAHTQAVPVSATRKSDDGDAHTREHRLPRGAAAGAMDHETGSRSGLPTLSDRKLLHQREKEHFGGMRFGAGFFGWLTATGLFVLLSALVGAIAALFGFGGNLSTSDLANASVEAQTTGITAAVVLGVILFVSYFAGGYVAGRMARFSGLKQGVAVWLWALIVAVVLAIIGFIVGNQAATTTTQQFEGLGVPSVQDLAGPGLIGLLVVAAVALIAAILGGLTGMRYHRRIDRTDFDALEDAA